MVLAANSEVDEVIGTFEDEPDESEDRYFSVPVRVPDDWKPADALDVPGGEYAAHWDETADRVRSRLKALLWAACCNREMSPQGSWWIVVEMGDELPNDLGYEVRVQDGSGVASIVANYPLRVITATAAEKAKVFAMLARKDAAVA
jgi:hypothetical protein